MQGALGQLLADEPTIEHPAISVEIQIRAGLFVMNRVGLPPTGNQIYIGLRSVVPPG